MHVGCQAGLSTFVTFHALPCSVPGPSYASGPGPVNSWYDDGAATRYPWLAICRANRCTGPVTKTGQWLALKRKTGLGPWYISEKTATPGKRARG